MFSAAVSPGGVPVPVGCIEVAETVVAVQGYLEEYHWWLYDFNTHSIVTVPYIP